MLFSEIAKSIHRPWEGADGEVTGFNTPDRAAPGELIILFDKKAVRQLTDTRAGFWVLSAPLINDEILATARMNATAFLVSDTIHDDLIRLISLMRPDTSDKPFFHPTAIIHPSCSLEADIIVHPHAVIGEGCRIGQRVVIGNSASIGKNVTLGNHTLIYPNVTIYDHCVIGENVIIHAGSVIGSDGFGYHKKEGRYNKIPHIGNVVIEDDVEIGANCCIDRGTIGETRIKKGTKIDNLVQVAHNVIIGENTVIAAQAGIAGSTVIGDSVTIAGQAGLVGHITIGDRVTIGAQAGVIGSVENGKTVSGYPARDHSEALRKEAYINRLPQMWEMLRKLIYTIK